MSIAELYEWVRKGDDCVISSARNGRHGRRKILLRQSSRANKLFVWSSDYVVWRYAWRAFHDRRTRRSISCGNNTLLRLLSDKRTDRLQLHRTNCERDNECKTRPGNDLIKTGPRPCQTRHDEWREHLLTVAWNCSAAVTLRLMFLSELSAIVARPW